MAAGAFEQPPRWAVRGALRRHRCIADRFTKTCALSSVLQSATFSLQVMVRLPQMLLKMLRYMRDRWLEFCAAPTEAPEELLNSGIGVLTREDESIHNPENSCNSSSSTQQLQDVQLQCTAELSPAVAKKDDLGMIMNHCLSGKSEMEKEEIYDRMDVKIKLQGILSKLVVWQEYDLLDKQVRQEGIPNVETLRGVMSLIFENAAVYPTQCAKFAQLCVRLSKLKLPNFPGDKMMITFQSVLLNTCQEAFEKLTKPEQAVERADDSEKRMKLRPLGNIKLLGELFNVKLLPEKIVHGCIQELLGQDPKATPAEENVEALCHLFTTVGKQLEESAKSKMAFDTYIARLKVISESQVLPSRIRFMVRGILDMRSNKWVLREEMKTKTINEIHAEADAKLGLRPGVALRNRRAAAMSGMVQGAGRMLPGWPGIPGMKGMPAAPMMGSFMGPRLKANDWETVSNMRKSRKDGTGVSSREEMKAKSGLPTKTTALQNERPAATPKLLPGVGGMVPGVTSAVPSILGMPGMPGGGGPVQQVDVCRKTSEDKEAVLSVPVVSDVKVMESGAGRVAAMPKPRVRDHIGVRANKDNYNLRDLLHRVKMSDK